MQLFKCQNCSQLLHFENESCEQCGYRLGYVPEIAGLSALRPGDGVWRPLALQGKLFRFCANAEFAVCNWLIETTSHEYHCLSCRHNRIIPDLSVAGNLQAWRKLEAAKHRLFHSLLRLKLPLQNRNDDPSRGLAFDFLALPLEPYSSGVMTEHSSGQITIALAEADDVERERRRTAMCEPYRTLLGHFRHEAGHYFWERLVRQGGKLDACREVFGDDRVDYPQALQSYYACGAHANWQANFVSPYATAHPWEDFAETWAHYLHIVDTLEMANSLGMSIRPLLAANAALNAEVYFDPYSVDDVNRLIDTWIPLSVALNSLNRTMGQPDLYPFVLTPPIITKLALVHDVVRARDLSGNSALRDQSLSRSPCLELVVAHAAGG